MLKILTDTTNRNGIIRAKQFRQHNPKESSTEYTITTKAGSRPTDNFIEVFDFRYDAGVRGRVDKDLCPTLTTKVGTGGISGQPLLKVPQATKQKGLCNSRRRRWSIPRQTSSKKRCSAKRDDTNHQNKWLRCWCSCKGHKKPGNHTPIENPKLTPKECWRLMGFDDEDHDKVKEAGISDAQRYKMAGNSIVVNVIEKNIRKFN